MKTGVYLVLVYLLCKKLRRERFNIINTNNSWRERRRDIYTLWKGEASLPFDGAAMPIVAERLLVAHLRPTKSVNESNFEKYSPSLTGSYSWASGFSDSLFRVATPCWIVSSIGTMSHFGKQQKRRLIRCDGQHATCPTVSITKWNTFSETIRTSLSGELSDVIWS